MPRLRVVKPDTAAVEPAPTPDSNLPHALTGFVGREHELAEVAEALATARLVTLCGASGIGKTRFAIELARRLLGRHPGGTCMVELAALREPEHVVQAVASALCIDQEPGRDPLDVVLARLPRRPLLFVIDNCEHLVAASAGLIARLLQNDQVAVVATSQRALDVAGELVHQLAPLTLPRSGARSTVQEALASEAVGLFCARAAAGHSGFRLTEELVADVVEVCRRLDGIPLAIELAAARASVLAPAEISQRLDQRFTLLTGGLSASERHRTLEAALDWSYQMLPAREAALLRRLSIFTGGAELHAVEQVCPADDITRVELVDLLSALVAKSLLVADTSRPRARYRMLESIQAYGHDRLIAAGEAEAVGTRHSSWCVGVVERAWHELSRGNPGPSVEAVEADYDNIRAALERSLHSAPELGLRLAAGLMPFWKMRGYFREGQEWLERAVATSDHASTALRARALCALGLLATLRGDIPAATAAVQESLALSRERGQGRGTIAALNLLGFISIFAQDAAAAMPLLDESVQLAQSAGDASSLVSALALSGRAHLFLGDTAAARKVFDECLRLSAGDGSQETALIGIGWVALAQGRFDEAAEAFSRGLTLVRQAGDRFDTALVLSFLGELAWVHDDLEESRVFLEEGLDLAEAMGAPFPLARCLSGLARVALAEGDLGEAKRLADEAVKVARQARLPYALIRCLHAHGDLREPSEDPAGARGSFGEALALARENRDKAGMADSLGRLAGLARADGDHERAVALQHEALVLHAETGDLAGTARAIEALAGLAVDHGHEPHASRLFGAAVALREAAGAVRNPAEAAGYNRDIERLRVSSDEMQEKWAQGGSIRLDEVLALAARGRGARDRPAGGWDSLTPTERQVVELAVEGLTNPEIGEKLFISPRTVQGHLARTYRKLGISSRRQLRGLRPG